MKFTKSTLCFSIFLLCAAICFVCDSQAQPLAFDHIVVVIEENHSFGDIIGNPAAPNINALANSGANIVNASTDPQGNTSGSHAVRHPSQPNYLELYSGSNQGTIQDGHPGTGSEPFSSPPPFTTPNVGAALRNAGFSFATYSQTLPSVGFDGDSNGAYQRK
jgi:phosphatidylinositol-3-phosphatase